MYPPPMKYRALFALTAALTTGTPAAAQDCSGEPLSMKDLVVTLTLVCHKTFSDNPAATPLRTCYDFNAAVGECVIHRNDSSKCADVIEQEGNKMLERLGKKDRIKQAPVGNSFCPFPLS